MSIEKHPAVIRFRERQTARDLGSVGDPQALDAEWLKRICLEAGADDVGLVEIDRAELAEERKNLLRHFPQAKTLLSFVCRMNRTPIQSPARSLANLEFHHRGQEVDQVGHRVVEQLERIGVRALNPAMGFPMEMHRFPERIWIVSHKPVAVAAGLGRMGIHRNLIHPRFGNFILLGTVLLDAEATAYDRPVDYNPCLECKLCVAACPVGAVAVDGRFDFSACYTHNYREFMSGFADWTEQVVESRGGRDYRQRVNDAETVSLWQSLSFGPNYKAAYCMAVCPAGDEVIGGYLDDRKRYVQEVVRPLQDKEETVYVVPGSDAAAHLVSHFKHKTPRYIRHGLRPPSVQAFLDLMPHVFQRQQAKNLDARYHFRFTGEESCEATVLIRHGTLELEEGHVGRPDLVIKADSRAWLQFLAGEQHIAWALLRRKVRLKGPPRLLLAFGRCFPGLPPHPPRTVKGPTAIRTHGDRNVGPAMPPPSSSRWTGNMTVTEILDETPNMEFFDPSEMILPELRAVPASRHEAKPLPAATVSFLPYEASVTTAGGGSILDLAEQAGVEIDNACRSGTCGSCKVRVISGAVEMDFDDALEAEERAQGLILACQAIPSGDVVVEV